MLREAAWPSRRTPSTLTPATIPSFSTTAPLLSFRGGFSNEESFSKKLRCRPKRGHMAESKDPIFAHRITTVPSFHAIGHWHFRADLHSHLTARQSLRPIEQTA